VNNNVLGDESAIELIESLKGAKGNKKLRKISIHHNGISIRFLEEI